MAMIAMSRPRRATRGGFEGLKAVAGSPGLRAAGAAALFIAAAAAVVLLMGPMGARPIRIHLGPVFDRAPQGWRQSLGPQSMVWLSEDVVRLSERPLGPLAGLAANAVEAARPAPAGGALPQAPIAGFYAPGPGGPLPIIAPDGRTPYQAYARPFVANGRPRIALVVGGLGLNARATQTAIDTLPPQITLSFVPYAEGLQGWIDMARGKGHEVLLETPMEPVDYPDNDPGPYTLMAQAPANETAKKLDWILSRASGYFALTNYLGSRFLGDDKAYEGFMGAVRGRGLGFIDDGLASRRTGGGAPRASAERVIDDQLTQAAIDQQLLQLEASALERGQALGAGFAYPVTLDKVARWAQGVEQRGYQLAPASALAVKR
ncbi:MAG: hypothetical protein JWQ97_1735 [Phenylobacterium sp.]|nr:hypothetical protein [Phenylobacterium sp.]